MNLKKFKYIHNQNNSYNKIPGNLANSSGKSNFLNLISCLTGASNLSHFPGGLISELK